MGIAALAPRGGLAEQLAGASRPLLLRNAEIERFEDAHGGIFAFWDGLFGRGEKPTSRQVRDLIALGLVGAGMGDQAADDLVAGLGPDENLRLYTIAQGLIGAAFLPDSVEGGGDEPQPESEASKKTAPAPGG